MVFPIALFIGWVAKTLITCAICGGTCYCAKKIYYGYNKSSKRQKEKIALKGKALEKKIEETNKIQSERDEWKKKYNDLDGKINSWEKEAKKIKEKLRDPNLTEEDRKKLNSQLTLLTTQIEDGIKEKESILDKIKDLEKKIKDNNNAISGALSNLDDRHWIWELFTLENILVAGGCYVVYKLLKDDK